MENRNSTLGSSSLSAGDVLEVLFRHKKKAIFFPLFFLTLGVLVLLFAPRKYASESKIFLQIGRESVKLDPTATISGDRINIMSGDRADEIITAIDLLKSRGLLTKVVEKLTPEVVLGEGGIGKKKEPQAMVQALKNAVGQAAKLIKSIDPISEAESAIVELERHLDVEAEHDSTLIAIRIQADTPELAQLITHTLVEIYRQEHLRMHRTSGSKKFFSEQYADLQKQLDEAVEKLRKAKNELNIVSLEARRGTLESRLAGLELSRNENARLLAGSEARITDLKKQIAQLPERIINEETTSPNTGADMLRSQLYALEVQMMDQQAKYSDDHPALQATREQIKEAQAKLGQEQLERRSTVTNLNPNRRALQLSLAEEESQLASLDAQKAELVALIAGTKSDLQALNDHELEIDQLERAEQLARTSFFRYAENLEKARIDQELDKDSISNVIVAQEATLAEKPVSPNKLIVVALTVLLAGCSGVAMVLLGEQTSDNIYSEEQLERSLQLPVLASIPNRREFARITV